MRNASIAALILGLWAGMAGPAGAAPTEESPAVQPALDAGLASPEVEYAFGTVKKAAADQVLISEFDYDTGEEKEVSYQLDPKVEISGAASVAEIAPGDEVDVDYVTRQEKRVAVSLVVAKPAPAGEGEGEGE